MSDDLIERLELSADPTCWRAAEKIRDLAFNLQEALMFAHGELRC